MDFPIAGDSAGFIPFTPIGIGNFLSSNRVSNLKLHFKRATGNPTMRSPAEEKTQDQQRSIPNVTVKKVDRKRGENEASRRLNEKYGKWLRDWIQLKRTADIFGVSDKYVAPNSPMSLGLRADLTTVTLSEHGLLFDRWIRMSLRLRRL
jgi:hypothetical protein